MVKFDDEKSEYEKFKQRKLENSKTDLPTFQYTLSANGFELGWSQHLFAVWAAVARQTDRLNLYLNEFLVQGSIWLNLYC